MRAKAFIHKPLIPYGSSASNCDSLGVTRLVIQGSTGSIGCSALEIVRRYRDRFQVVALCAGGNIELLAQQAREFSPEFVCCRDDAGREVLSSAVSSSIVVGCGEEALVEVAQSGNYDLMLAAVVGVAGLKPVLAALESGKRVALANKESLVAGGRFVAEALARGGGTLLPVDSEHSALFQALQGERLTDLQSLVLTASGGPFLRYSAQELASVTPAQAVRHPRWNMGAKISIDSATLMNKALELIEAYWLFGVAEERIEVLVHPQSIVHSLVRLIDGSEIAQLSVPDMKGAIGYAFSYPHGRLAGLMPQLSLAEVRSLEFFELDAGRFPAVALARETLRQGGAASAVFNLANEIAVDHFMQGRLTFTGILSFVERTLARYGSNAVTSIDGLFALMEEVRRGAAVGSASCSSVI
ncbi:MAG: 1-deoxy-D-xylulose-5-phosphate reductoisomerase [Proteobacteria bacterium]|nr:1-deoxy-D-xylulose-5-phosphate reductoisomerase [Pseudomonadota bacterium]